MQVDDAFVREVMDRFNAYKGKPKATDEEMFRAGAEIVLAVAAERGMVVPEGAEWLDAVRTESGNLLLRFSHYRPLPGEKLVRVAVVEIKE